MNAFSFFLPSQIGLNVPPFYISFFDYAKSVPELKTPIPFSRIEVQKIPGYSYAAD
jgi:hypothetical protein